MKKLIAAALAVFTASAMSATLYLDDGTTVDLEVGSKVYVSDGQLWEFTRFNEDGFDIRPAGLFIEVKEECSEGGGFTFGGGSVVCSEVVEITETEPQDCLTFGGDC